MIDIKLENWVYACIARLTDNFEWHEQDIDIEDRCQLEQLLIDAISANKELADNFVNVCLNHGIVEHDYFDEMETV
jgi:predicted SAM-dependent methyltransferase